MVFHSKSNGGLKHGRLSINGIPILSGRGSIVAHEWMNKPRR